MQSAAKRQQAAAYCCHRCPKLPPTLPPAAMPCPVLQASQGAHKAVLDAYAAFRSKQDAASLEELVKLVEAGTGGSAACLALCKVLRGPAQPACLLPAALPPGC